MAHCSCARLGAHSILDPVLRRSMHQESMLSNLQSAFYSLISRRSCLQQQQSRWCSFVHASVSRALQTRSSVRFLDEWIISWHHPCSNWHVWPGSVGIENLTPGQPLNLLTAALHMDSKLSLACSRHRLRTLAKLDALCTWMTSASVQHSCLQGLLVLPTR